MAQGTQRLRYFDGQFLRSGDFTDEQSYHVAVRRQLNLEMGLIGVVSGAGIQIDQNSVPPAPPQRTPGLAAASAASTAAGVEFLSLGTGYVIDQLGREIQISAPTSLTPLLSRAGLKAGPNELWIVYTETASGSPAPGYQLCNELSQNTRWTESFDLILRPLSVAPDPNAPDPNRDLMGVCLGIVMVTSGGAGPSFLLPPHWWHRRRYAGIRAQRIVAPDQIADPAPVTIQGPNVLPPHGYLKLETPNGVYSDGNLIVQNDILVGDDFTIQNTNPPGPAPNPTNVNGNLKLNSDIFLNGQLYQQSNGNWVTLDDYLSKLSSSVADVQFPTPPIITISIGGKTGVFPSGGGAIVVATTSLASFSKVDIQASIAGFTLVQEGSFTTATWSTNSTGLLNLSATATPTSASPATPVQISVTVQASGDAATTNSIFESVDVALIVVFRP